ncbi:hypothetical protein HDU76_012268 [Blyttiomyces sp. JEL0837]|nr:hypothetical protein HDU76_012268 [Blyttiomyces sp. JEL0837]
MPPTKVILPVEASSAAKSKRKYTPRKKAAAVNETGSSNRPTASKLPPATTNFRPILPKPPPPLPTPMISPLFADLSPQHHQMPIGAVASGPRGLMPSPFGAQSAQYNGGSVDSSPNKISDEVEEMMKVIDGEFRVRATCMIKPIGISSADI